MKSLSKLVKGTRHLLRTQLLYYSFPEVIPSLIIL